SRCSSLAASSDSTGNAGERRTSRSVMIRCDTRSASVSGDRSFFVSTSKSRSYTSRMASPAAFAIERICSSRSMCSLMIPTQYHHQMASHDLPLPWHEIDTVLVDMDGTLLDL